MGVDLLQQKRQKNISTEKNIIMGWTINYANPISIFTLIVITMVITIVSRYLKTN